ncbi:hypothetical protein [Neorhizobium sp. JUb45]|uniref:gp53-like domain-containing protein n=1 Tax=Neorhizobium sp. JUb45 TaxID=2485113 RepID=UPI001048BCF4|nr:hypothetical protein [Neorhizobium sp. JUb45]TCR01057.1 hypothetical protein EDF70_10562 [Neorhizobium sp. JUb45]
MAVLSKLAQQILAPVDENGIPRAISEQELGVWGTEVERLLAAIGAGEVDPADLPPTWAFASDAGAGTPNAIQATTVIPVTEAVLVVMNIAKTNGPGSVTVRFNGAAPDYIIKTNSGNDPAVGGVSAGTIVIGKVYGNTFRLLSDQASVAVLAEAEAALELVKEIRDEVIGSVPSVFSPNRAALKALQPAHTAFAYLTEGHRSGQFIWNSGDYSEAISEDPLEGVYVKSDTVSASAGAWVRVFSVASVAFWGAVGDGLSDDTDSIQAAIAWCELTGRSLYLPAPSQSYRTTDTLAIGKGVAIKGDGIVPYNGVPGGASENPRGLGSWIFADHTQNCFDIIPTTANGSGVHFKDFGVYRDRTIPPSGDFTPVDTGEEIHAENVELIIDNVCLLNPYTAVNFNGGGGRLVVKHLFGQPLQNGLIVDNAFDDIVVDKLHWWAYWSSADAVLNYTKHNARAISMGYAVDPIFSNIMVFGYYIGFDFFQGNAGADRHPTGRMIASNVDFNGVGYCIFVEPGVGPNAQFSNINCGGLPGFGGYAMNINGNSAYLVFNNLCIFDYLGSGGIFLTGTNNVVQINNLNSAATGSVLVCDGSSNLIQVTNQYAISLSGEKVVSSNGGRVWGYSGPGFDVDSKGVIRQWGSVDISNPTAGTYNTAAVNFPISFRTSVEKVSASMSGLPNPGSWSAGAGSPTLTGMQAVLSCSATFTGVAKIYWEAVGR